MRLAILALVLLAAPAAARADDVIWSPPPVAPGAPGTVAPYYRYPPPPTRTREVSYAYQTLISDGISVWLLASAFRQDNWASGMLMFSTGLGGYMFGAPLVHIVNGQVGNGFKSLGLRTGLPTLGMVAGNLIGPRDRIQCKVGQDCFDTDRSQIGSAVGAALGALAAVALDARYLARKRVIELVPQVMPTIGYARSGFHLGLGGSF